MEAKPYGTTVKTLEVRCAGSPNMRSQGGGALTFGPEDSPWDRTFTVDSSCGDVVTTVVETVEEHGGHVATNNWENVLADDGVVQVPRAASHSHSVSRSGQVLNVRWRGAVRRPLPPLRGHRLQRVRQ